MKFNISTKKMKKLINNVFKINIRSTNKTYSSLKIEASDDLITVSAYNNIEYIKIVEKDVEVFEKGKVVIDSKLLFDLVKNTDDISLEFQLFDESLLNINTLNSVYKINVLNVDFIDYEETKNDFNIKLNAYEVVDLIKHNIYAVDNSGINPIISGLNFKTQKNKITTFSTDSFRLSNSYIDIDNSFESDVIIYKKTAKDIISLIEENEIKEVNISIGRNSFIVEMEDIYLSSSIINGNYPRTADISNFINTNQIKIQIERTKLENIIKRLMIFSNDESKSIIISIERNKILFQNEDNIFGNGVESLSTNEEINSSFNILISGIYLYDALKNCSDTINLVLESEVKPIIIEDEKYKTSHLIIPLNM